MEVKPVKKQVLKTDRGVASEAEVDSDPEEEDLEEAVAEADPEEVLGVEEAVDLDLEDKEIMSPHLTFLEILQVTIPTIQKATRPFEFNCQHLHLVL